MDWVVLFASGVLEAVWASALAASNGFRRLWPTLLFLVASAGSLAGLGYAMLTLPPGTAYAIWVAIGALCTAGYAMATGAEPRSLGRVLLLLGIVACVVGLKVVA